MKTLKCKQCKEKTQHKKCGFEGYNQRYECLTCGTEDYYSGSKWGWFAIVLLLFMMPMVLGVECGVTPTDGCEVTADTTFDGGTYYLNDTNTNGVINLGASDITLDCNGATLIGNYTTSGKGIEEQSATNNVTVKNCNLKNYYYPLYFTNVDNLIVYNNTITNSYQAILLTLNTPVNISGNTITNFTNQGIRISGDSNSVIDNNILNTTHADADAGIYMRDWGSSVYTNNNTITNNIIYGNNVLDNGIINVHNSENNTIKNNQVYDTTEPSINMQRIYNSDIKNNIVNGSASSGIRIEIVNSNHALSNNRINNNTISNGTTTGTAGIYLNNINENTTIDGNIITGFDYGIRINQGGNNTIINNVDDGGSLRGSSTINRGIFLDEDTGYNNVSNNTISNGDMGIYLLTSNNNIIENNNINNITYNDDSYNVAVYLRDSFSNIVRNNTINKTETGIFLLNASNTQISNNYIKLATIGYSISSAWEPPACISVLPTIKSFIPGSGYTTFNSTITSQYESDNVTISGNNCNDANIFLRKQGNNITHDFTDYWYYAHKYPEFLFDSVGEFFINNDYDNVSVITGGALNILAKQGNFFNWDYEYSITKSWSYYRNTNLSTRQANIYNLTNALIYFSNGSVACSDISTCDNNINITLSPGNYSYVLDDFNLTEGVTRENSPLWFSATSDTSKSIASNLTDTINTKVIFNVQDCDTIGTITYTSDTGTYSQSWAGKDYCSSSSVTLPITGIETATASNKITISYNQASLDICEGWSDAGNTFVGFFIVIIIISVAGVILVLFLGDGELDLENIMVALIVVGIVLSIGASIILKIGGC